MSTATALAQQLRNHRNSLREEGHSYVTSSNPTTAHGPSSTKRRLSFAGNEDRIAAALQLALWRWLSGNREPAPRRG